MQDKNQNVLCPQCQVAVAPFAPYPHLTINLCQSCRHAWLDKGELALLLRRPEDLPPAAHADPTRAEPLPCPACSTRTLAPWKAGAVRFWRCRSCSGLLVALAQVQTLKTLFPKDHQDPRPPIQAPRRDALPDDYSRTVHTPWFDLIAIPLVLIVGFFLAYKPAFLMFAWPVATFFHELGHALAAWLGGFFAVPTPFAFTAYGGERRGLVIAFFLALWLWGIVQAFNLRSYVLMVTSCVLLTTQIKMSFFMSKDQVLEIATASGIGLELIYGGLLIAAFHYRLPRLLRWDFWRFPALLFGMVIYSHTIILWIKIKFGLAPLPWGSAVGTLSDGDLNKLLRIWQWTEADIIDRFFGLAVLSLAWILGHYLVSLPFLIRQIKSASTRRQP